MDKVFSIRLDEIVVGELNRVSKRLGITKKRFLEEAIRRQVSFVAKNKSVDIWEETCGAWKRQESPSITIRKARQAFEASVLRHHRHQKRPRI